MREDVVSRRRLCAFLKEEISFCNCKEICPTYSSKWINSEFDEVAVFPDIVDSGLEVSRGLDVWMESVDVCPPGVGELLL